SLEVGRKGDDVRVPIDGGRDKGDGNRKTGNGRRETGDGRRETGDDFWHLPSPVKRSERFACLCFFRLPSSIQHAVLTLISVSLAVLPPAPPVGPLPVPHAAGTGHRS